jgi:hypothetical protein
MAARDFYDGVIGMDEQKEVAVIPAPSYVVRGTAHRSGTDWTIHLPERSKVGDFPVGQVVREPFGACGKEIERADRLTLLGADDTFLVECIVTEPQATKLAALVREVVKLPPREMLGGDALPDNIHIVQKGGETGIAVERRNKDGSWHEVASEKNHPDWRGRPDKAREWGREYARTISETPGRI